MQYLVTGGAGFIGSNLVRELLRRGEEVVVIDNFSTGARENIPSGVPVVSNSYRNLSRLASINGVFHLGIPSSSPLYRENRGLVSHALGGFVRILEFAQRRNVKVVFASSSSLYNGNNPPWNEDMPVHVTDFYTEARHYIERLSTLYYGLYGVKSIGLRLFSVYGPGEEYKGRFANLVTQLIWARVKGEVFQIYGDGHQSRDLTYVADVVAAFILAMTSQIKHDFFNVGTGVAYPLNDLVDAIGAEVKHVDNPIKNYVTDTLADTAKARRVLGFKATHPFKVGLELTQAYYTSESVLQRIRS